jgi:hypothetical protein
MKIFNVDRTIEGVRLVDGKPLVHEGKSFIARTPEEEELKAAEAHALYTQYREDPTTVIATLNDGCQKFRYDANAVPVAEPAWGYA